MIWLSDDHGSPSGKFLPTRTRTHQNPYPYIQVRVPFLRVRVHTRSHGFANPYGFLLRVITFNLYILIYATVTNIIIRNIKKIKHTGLEMHLHLKPCHRRPCLLLSSR